MEPLDTQIISLTDRAALAVLELALRRPGLAPALPAADEPHEQLRAALHHADLVSAADLPVQPPSDGDIARATLLYLAQRDATSRADIARLLTPVPGSAPGATTHTDPADLGSLVLMALHGALELRTEPDTGWYFHVKVPPRPTSTLGKLVGMLYARFTD